MTLADHAVYEPLCQEGEHPEPYGPGTVLDLQDPFYASTSPQMYVLAAVTVLSYLLVIMLFITPRTFFIGGHGGGFLSRRGMISGSYGSSSVVGVGGRPWLQKVAALTVAISLTVASVDSFRVAEEQYVLGYMDSSALTTEVLNGLEIRIIRVVSGTFLWLAQVQTLIRLFPRHKEKVIIKWVGFALIVLDTIFTILNNFVNSDNNVFQPRNIVDAIPALNYLFDLSLSLLYAAWVIFYSLSKHRFAFFHVKMKNICLVALLSNVAVLIPITFFIVDLSKPKLAGWGEYIRWVGAAAASVVVWEWVERIEALEREERKDGILGREIFDGDEMLEITPSEEVDWPASRGGKGGGEDGEKGGHRKTWIERMGLSSTAFWSRVAGMRRAARPDINRTESSEQAEENQNNDVPPRTPVSRANSTASTAYRVRYHSEASPAPSTFDGSVEDGEEKEAQITETEGRQRSEWNRTPATVFKQSTGWLQNLLKRRRGSPPQEVATAQAAEEGNALRTVHLRSAGQQNHGSKGILSTAANFLPFVNLGKRSTDEIPTPLPVTVIPARSARRDYPEPEQTLRTREADPQNTSTTPAPPEPSITPAAQRQDILPVMVIPARPRSSRTWSSPGLDESHFADASSYVADTLSRGTVSPANAAVEHDPDHLDGTGHTGDSGPAQGMHVQWRDGEGSGGPPVDSIYHHHHHPHRVQRTKSNGTLTTTTASSRRSGSVDVSTPAPTPAPAPPAPARTPSHRRDNDYPDSPG